jgi:hypothetical protein
MLAIGLLSGNIAHAQSKAPPGGHVTLGGASGSPGDSLVVPIYYTPPEGVEVGRLKIEVNFVSANLKFNKIGKGIAAEMGGVEVSGDAKVDKNDKGVEVTTLTIVASIQSSESLKKGMPGGLLAYISMNIDKNGRPANITLRTSAEAMEMGTNKKLGAVQIADAKVEVISAEDKPLTDCFFFSH